MHIGWRIASGALKSFPLLLLAGLALAQGSLTPSSLTSLQPSNVKKTRSIVFEAPSGPMGTLDFSITESSTECLLHQDLPWVQVTPDTGSIPLGQSGTLTVEFDSNGLSPGAELNGSLCMTSFINDGLPTPGAVFGEVVPVSLLVVPEIEQIPTMSGWSALLMALVLGAFGALRLRSAGE